MSVTSSPREPLLQPPSGENDVFFKTYVPPARDDIHLPIHIFYIILASIVIVATIYAIIGHLIKDLVHDLADYLFGEQPEEVQIHLCETRDKFMVDWCPETSPELEELARAEEIRVVMEGGKYTPAIWIISDGIEPRPPRTGPRVAFGKNV
ncbi:uncharacterized protein LOC127441366 [Myxocyprinus asiaticus]|uniref:uncharacterized protein LOC127441366 n=1 Tax=Myxocyprinus asiaticus TaxID=70543 RepID=UPI00222335E8|nr:uncharacterized protein LOC127441366 [Myxocyprinus asiaticus]XP_051554659.1 uncharacterized protein LOC127441366 [Myxocyprinus asiaticus]XP_051554661.1 uncharacterized protein LOC127441366 [Myxocyprinus asiaticus]